MVISIESKTTTASSSPADVADDQEVEGEETESLAQSDEHNATASGMSDLDERPVWS